MLKWLRYRWVKFQIHFGHWWQVFKHKHLVAEYPHEDDFLWDDDDYVP